MRSLFVSILSILLLLGSLVSCEHKVPTVQSVTFDTLSVDTICPLFYSYDKPACHLAIRMAKPEEGTPNETLHAIERFISTLPKDGSFEEDANGSVESMVSAYVRSYIVQYLSEGRDAIGRHETMEDSIKAASTWMNYDEKVVGSILFNDDGFVSYQVVTDSYTGGAHGNKTINNGVFCLSNLDQITLDDLFNDVSKPDLNVLIRTELMKQNGCETIEELADKAQFLSPNDIEAPDNFFLNKDGITWTYNPYEIAPYSVGDVSVSLTWKELITLLAPDAPVIEFAKKYSVES